MWSSSIRILLPSLGEVSSRGGHTRPTLSPRPGRQDGFSRPVLSCRSEPAITPPFPGQPPSASSSVVGTNSLSSARPDERSTLEVLLENFLGATDDGTPQLERAVRAGELPPDVLARIEALPKTFTKRDYSARTLAMSQLTGSLKKGILPAPGELEWPQEPFKSEFLTVLNDLEMPRFTRKHPKLMRPLIDRMLEMVDEFEVKLLEAERAAAEQQRNPLKPPAPPPNGTGLD